MKALAYFGQQTIQANSTNTTISSQEQMNGITYSVKADPLATDGTWAGVNYSGSTAPMITRGLAE